MKKFLNKIYLHPIFLFTIFIFVLIGKFKFLIYFMLAITIHEFGHIIMSLIFSWKIEKIIILPFGCLIKYNIKINTPIFEELLVSISGVIFQEFVYIFLVNVIKYKYFFCINYFIILFNLIPIHPLDGSKIINLVLNIFKKYKKSLLLTISISYILIAFLSFLFFYINRLFILIFIFLFLETNKLNKEKNSLFNKFLLERHIETLRLKKEIIVNSINDMKRDCRHIFFIFDKYITEKSYLNAYFNKKYY